MSLPFENVFVVPTHRKWIFEKLFCWNLTVQNRFVMKSWMVFVNSPSATESAASKEHLEKIHGTVETGAWSTASFLDGSFTPFIVNRAFLLIWQDFISHGNLLELFSLIWILNISRFFQFFNPKWRIFFSYLVGVVFQGELSVCFLQVVRRTVGLNALK